MIKKYCKNGHERVSENLYANGTCRTCALARATQRNKELGAAGRYTRCKSGHDFSAENVVQKRKNRRCRVCSAVKEKGSLHSEHPEITERRYYQWNYKYGITREQYDALFEKQDGKCAICRNPETRKSYKTGLLFPLHVDHNHQTDAIRGLLCAACNRAIGLLGDSFDRVVAAAEYLKQFLPIYSEMAA